MEFANTSLESLRQSLSTLLLQRDMLEIEADAIFSELTSPGPNGEPPIGIRESLIDEEGFPRGDIDVYNAKNKRRRLSEINYDHKALMKQVEAMMKQIFDLGGTLPPVPSVVDSASADSKPVHHSHIHEPMAILDQILPDSPAAMAGIQEGDQLVRFGHVTSEDKQALPSIAKLVGESVNQNIHILVRRGSDKHIVELTLVPKTWGGRGLLGCHLTPVKK